VFGLQSSHIWQARELLLRRYAFRELVPYEADPAVLASLDIAARSTDADSGSGAVQTPEVTAYVKHTLSKQNAFVLDLDFPSFPLIFFPDFAFFWRWGLGE
jgi:hypothetical protein